MQRLSIDFISDVMCPWCMIGLGNLLKATDRVQDRVILDIRLRPFELNPGMPSGGQNILAHIQEKYGSPPEQSGEMRERVRAAAASAGFDIRVTDEDRIYNSFNAHRLLRWVKPDVRILLKLALFKAYFAEGLDPGRPDVLADVAEQLGHDPEAVRSMLASDAEVAEVRREEAEIARAGVSAVPAVVINGRFLLSGAQSVEAYERAMLEIAAGK